MADTEVTAATAPATEVTDQPTSEEQTPAAESVKQDSTAETSRFQELETRIKDFEALVAERDRQLSTARDAALREEAVRKGIQRESTQKMQELAQLKLQLANQELTSGKLDRMERLVAKLAETNLDPETVKELNASIEQDRLRQENDRLKATIEERAKAATQEVEPQGNPLDNLTVDQKQQLLEYYFPETTLKPEDSRIDWATSASSREEWFRRAGASVRKLEREDQERSFADRIKANQNEELQAFREEQAKLLAEQKSEIERLKTEATATEHKEQEETNRKKGMDREDTARSEGSSRRKSVMQQLNDIPDSWAKGTPEQRKEYEKRMRNLREQALKGLGNF